MTTDGAKIDSLKLSSSSELPPAIHRVYIHSKRKVRLPFDMGHLQYIPIHPEYFVILSTKKDNIDGAIFSYTDPSKPVDTFTADTVLYDQNSLKLVYNNYVSELFPPMYIGATGRDLEERAEIQQIKDSDHVEEELQKAYKGTLRRPVELLTNQTIYYISPHTHREVQVDESVLMFWNQCDDCILVVKNYSLFVYRKESNDIHPDSVLFRSTIDNDDLYKILIQCIDVLEEKVEFSSENSPESFAKQAESLFVRYGYYFRVIAKLLDVDMELFRSVEHLFATMLKFDMQKRQRIPDLSPQNALHFIVYSFFQTIQDAMVYVKHKSKKDKQYYLLYGDSDNPRPKKTTNAMLAVLGQVHCARNEYHTHFNQLHSHMDSFVEKITAYSGSINKIDNISFPSLNESFSNRNSLHSSIYDW